MGYSKLFSEIIMSTIWREPDHVRILWITMLAIKDRWHKVNSSIPGLADAAKISIPQCVDGLITLSSPDPYSRTKDNEGRRIAECDGGWIILNGEKYRNKMSLDERREYNRIKQREYRSKNSHLSNSCVHSSTKSAHTDTDTDTDTYKKQKRGNFVPPSLQEVIDYCKERNNNISANNFLNFYEAKGWMVGKNKMKDWKACIRTWEQRQQEHGNGQRDNRSRAKRHIDRLDEIAREDIAKNGFTNTLGD